MQLFVYSSALSLLFSNMALPTAYGQWDREHAVDCQCSDPHHRHIRHAPTVDRSKANAPDWTTLASTYTHDNEGHRVDQHTMPVEPQSNERPDMVKSGYRYSRSSIQSGFGADHYHTTEQWGPAIQPYGQWRYPFRPYSVPYGAWGPQLPQVVGGGLWNGIGPFPQPNAMLNGPWPGNVPPRMQNNPNGQGNNQGNGQNNGQGNGQGNGQWNGQWNGPNNNGPWNGPGGWNGPGNWNGPGGSGGWNAPGYQNQGGAGAFGVGPGNALPPTQDEYYPQAPIYQPLNNGYLNSPYRN